MLSLLAAFSSAESNVRRRFAAAPAVKLDFVIVPEEDGRSCNEREAATEVGVYERMEVGVSEGEEWFEGRVGGVGVSRVSDDAPGEGVGRLDVRLAMGISVVAPSSVVVNDPSADPVPLIVPEIEPIPGGSTKAEVELAAEWGLAAGAATNGDPGE